MSTTPLVTLDGSSQIAPSPDLSLNPHSSSQKFKTMSELMSTTTRVTLPPDDSSQMASSSNEFHLSSSWAPTDTNSDQSKSWSSHRHLSPPASSPGQPQDHVPSPPNLGEHLPSDNHPLSSGSSTAEYYLGSPDRLSTERLGSPDQSSTADYYLGSPDRLSAAGLGSPDRLSTARLGSPDRSSTAEYYLDSPDLSSTDESHPPTPGPTDNHPPPASSSNPGPQTEPNPPQSAKRPRPEEDSSWSFIKKLAKGKLKRRLSGPGAFSAAQRDLQGTFNSRGYVFPPSPVNKRLWSRTF